MSRLDSFIRRITAQRDILNGLVPLIQDLPGPIFEFGLGSGRTYDHLRECFPGRRLYVFECVAGDSLLSRARPQDLVIGDIRATTAAFPDGCAALIHTDIETGDAACDAGLAAWLPALVARLLAPGGYAASGCALVDPRLDPQPLPAGIAEGRYAVVRRCADPGVRPLHPSASSTAPMPALS